MSITSFNVDTNEYEVIISTVQPLKVRTESEDVFDLNGAKICAIPTRYFLSGCIVDALAKYENTGLTPEKINEVCNELLRLQASNEILRKNNDEYFIKYQELLDENYKLKKLVKYLLDR